MKYIILTLICFLTLPAYAVRDIEVPLEMDAFQLEYSDISKTGVIRVKNCLRCKQELYEFNDTIEIKRSGKTITLNELMSEYWNVKYPTIFLKLDENKAIRINY